MSGKTYLENNISSYMRYYIDTCVWIDFVEDESYAVNVFLKIITDEDIVLMSRIIAKEFFRYKKYENIASLVKILDSKNLIENVSIYSVQENEATILSKDRDIPEPDALHAILARDNDAVLVTRDKHFLKLKDICEIICP
jgi:predicted nucleic acid-binding protein